MGHPSTPMWTQKIRTLAKLAALFPGSDSKLLWDDVNALAESPDFNAKQKLLLDIYAATRTDPQLADDLQNMRAAGFGLAHMMLYMAAPETSPLGTQTTRAQYLKQWNADKDFVPHQTSQELMERGAFAISSLVAIGGAISVFGGVSVGFLVNNPALVQSFKIMSSPMGLIQDLTDAITNPTITTAISSLVALCGGAYAGFQLRDQIQRAQDVDLRTALHVLPDFDDARQSLLVQVGALSKSMQHLLSHFSPEELSLFMASDEKAQASMWRANPPSFEQRCNSLFCEEGSWAQKWRTKLEMTCSQWDNESSLFRQPVSLKENLTRLRSRRSPPNPATTLPSL